MTEVKSVEEIKENIARAFIEEHNLQNMLDENGNRRNIQANLIEVMISLMKMRIARNF